VTLPVGWGVATLPELIGADGVFSDGDWVETKDQNPDGEIRLTQLADIGEGFWRNRSERYMTSAAAHRLRCTFLEPGDVLVARMPDPLGRACQFPGDPRRCVTAVDVCIVRPGASSVDARLLMWWLNTPYIRKAVSGLQAGTTRKRISRKNLATIPLPIPPLAEQRRIVAAIEEQVSQLDGARVAEVFRRSLLQAELGQGWPRRVLGDVADTQLGKMLSPKSQAGANPRPYLRNKNVQWWRIDVDDVLTMDFDEREVAKFELVVGDVLVCEGGEVGRAAIWHGEIGGCCFQKALHRVRPSAELSAEYLVLVLRWLAYRNEFAAHVTGSTIAHLPQEDLRQVSIPLPTPEEQEAIVSRVLDRLDQIDRLVVAAVAAEVQASRLRQSILGTAFRGELVRQDPADEPASVLLERIAAERAAAPKPTRRRLEKASA